MDYIKRLVGDRIYLSPQEYYDDEDLKKFTEWMNDFNTIDYLGRSGYCVTYAGEKEYLEKVKDSNNYNFKIVAIDGDVLIGSISLENIQNINRTATLGVFIGNPDYRSKGYGTEAIRLILEFGFKYLNLHSIKLDLLSFNERAHKSYLKAGFKDAGRTRENKFVDGKYYDTIRMDILASEFEGDYIRNKNI